MRPNPILYVKVGKFHSPIFSLPPLSCSPHHFLIFTFLGGWCFVYFFPQWNTEISWGCWALFRPRFQMRLATEVCPMKIVSSWLLRSSLSILNPTLLSSLLIGVICALGPVFTWYVNILRPNRSNTWDMKLIQCLTQILQTKPIYGLASVHTSGYGWMQTWHAIGARLLLRWSHAGVSDTEVQI